MNGLVVSRVFVEIHSNNLHDIRTAMITVYLVLIGYPVESFGYYQTLIKAKSRYFHHISMICAPKWW